MKKALFGAFALVALTVMQASAATIDFSNGVWSVAPFTDTTTVGNTTVSSTPGLPLGWLNQDSNGMGITSIDDLYINPDVTALEVLTVDFAQPFSLTSFVLSDFTFLETAYYKLNGASTWQSVTQAGFLANSKTVTLSPTLVSSIEFGFDSATLAAFRVRSVTGDFQTTTPTVPEPTSMLLLGSGLAGLYLRKRQTRA
jgi:hypothetical protein